MYAGVTIDDRDCEWRCIETGRCGQYGRALSPGWVPRRERKPVAAREAMSTEEIERRIADREQMRADRKYEQVASALMQLSKRGGDVADCDDPSPLVGQALREVA